MKDLLAGATRASAATPTGQRPLRDLKADFMRQRARHGDHLWDSIEGKALALALAGREYPSETSPELVFAAPRTIALHWELENLVTHEQRTILLVGEGGTGKEQLATLVRNLLKDRLGAAADVPDIGGINCATLTESIAEALLFGVEGGLGLNVPKQGTAGLVEEADGGVLFLDEFFDAPASVFPKLLRLLEAREWRRVGGRVRKLKDQTFIVAASNRYPSLAHLAQAVSDGWVRPDLLDRFDAKLEVPPLRERKEEIPAMARRLFQALAGRILDDRRTSPIPVSLGESVQRALCTLPFDWPGNVRDLRRFLSDQLRFRASEIRAKGTLDLDAAELADWFRPRADSAARVTAGANPLPAWDSGGSEWMKTLRERQLVNYLKHRLALEPSASCDLTWVAAQIAAVCPTKNVHGLVKGRTGKTIAQIRALVNS